MKDEILRIAQNDTAPVGGVGTVSIFVFGPAKPGFEGGLHEMVKGVLSQPSYILYPMRQVARLTQQHAVNGRVLLVFQCSSDYEGRFEES
jgi:hypothetical protein